MSACPACAAAPLAQEAAAPPDLQFSVPGIHCAACIGKIERAMSKMPGVQSARVNLSLKRLSVSGTVAPDAVQSSLQDLGFASYPLDLAALNSAQDGTGRALLTRLAVAGFAMMNVMLLSVAVWSGAAGATRDLFHLISAGIAVPVVIYAAQPFFQSAWTALRVRRLNMDVPISLAIALATLMSLYETLNSGHHAYFDAALSLTFFLLIGRYLDHTTRQAARSAARELTALEVHTAELLTPSGRVSVPVPQIEVGDKVLVPSGGRVPVDGTLSTPQALMDRSFLTGESKAITLDQHDTLQAGEVNLGAPITMVATHVGQDTTLRRMAALVETAENSRNSYTALADRAARVYAPAVHLLALVAFLGWAFATGDLRHALNVAIAVLIITCPCALGLAVPAVTTVAISRLFSKGYLVKHSTALERLAEVDHVVFDKTGTLTTPEVMTLDQLAPLERAIALALAQSSDHPVSQALVQALPDVTPAPMSEITETHGAGVTGFWQGQRVKLGRGDWVAADLSGLCLRIGDAPAIPLETPEKLRAGVQDALARLDLSTEIVTGDAKDRAAVWGDTLGVPVLADVRPEVKLAHLNRLSDQGRHVLMVGDGLNDTPALAQAHASIAPSTALEVSRSAADIVLLRDSFADLPLVLSVARATQRLSRQNFAIATLYNLIAVPIALAGFATPLAAALAMSASSISVLANAMRMRLVK
ncbi:heavy metal translocating P-type ATPase [Yoonia sp. R2331]|uniref:heavy metal translocating P-type ATPase n=1 Tax=Yoonia sp. R2331 TaxID=3237238 RepID=UPI0034E55DF8